MGASIKYVRPKGEGGPAIVVRLSNVREGGGGLRVGNKRTYFMDAPMHYVIPPYTIFGFGKPRTPDIHDETGQPIYF